MDKRIAFIYSDTYLKHDTGRQHPERKERLVAILDHLNGVGLIEELTLAPSRLATVQEVALVHPRDYIDQIQRAVREGVQYLDPDTRVSAESYEVALQAAGGTLTIEVFKTTLKDRALEYAPDLILISAGFDAHRDDPLSDTRLTPEGFERMSEVVSQIAETKCNSRIVSVLEGGYNLQALAESVEIHLQVLRREM